MLFGLQESFLLFNDFCQSGLRLQVDLTKYSPREPVIKQALRTETTAIMKGLKRTKHLLKSEKKKKEGKSIVFPQRDFGEGRWLQRFEINKDSHTETENLHSKWQDGQKKKSYPGSYSLSEIALKMFMFIGNLGENLGWKHNSKSSLKTWKIEKALMKLRSGQFSVKAQSTIHLMLPSPSLPDPHC